MDLKPNCNNGASEIMPETYNYAIIEVMHRLNLNKPINYEVIVLDKVIGTSIQHKCNIDGTKCWSELQILYRDDENKIQCGHYDLKEYKFKILKLGDFQLEL